MYQPPDGVYFVEINYKTGGHVGGGGGGVGEGRGSGLRCRLG